MQNYTTGILDELAAGYSKEYEDFKQEYLTELPSRKMLWAEKFSQILTESGHTVKKFAELCGVSTTVIQNWRKGKAIPGDREKFIRIGFAAGYDLAQMNDFLQRYGRYHELYIKDLDDIPIIFVLESKTLPHDYQTCEILSQHMKQIQCGRSTEAQPVYATAQLMDDFSQVNTEDELMQFIQKHGPSFHDAYSKFYDYIKFHLDLNRTYYEYDGTGSKLMTIEELDEEQQWSSSLRKSISAIRSGNWPLRRNKILSLGLHLNMNREMFDEMLTRAHMKGLYAQNPAERILIYALEQFQLEQPDEQIVQDGSSELRDMVRDLLLDAGIEEAEYLEKEL